jgi:hypothetical protein
MHVESTEPDAGAFAGLCRGDARLLRLATRAACAAARRARLDALEQALVLVLARFLQSRQLAAGFDLCQHARGAHGDVVARLGPHVPVFLFPVASFAL